MSRVRLWWDWIEVFCRTLFCGNDYLLIRRGDWRKSWETATTIHDILQKLRAVPSLSTWRKQGER